LTKQYKGGYDRQSVLSAAGKLSCNKTALKRCTKTEIIIIIINLFINYYQLFYQLLSINYYYYQPVAGHILCCTAWEVVHR